MEQIMTFHSISLFAVTLGLTVLQSACAQDVLYQEWVYVERADSTVPMEGYFSMFKCRAELDEHLDLDSLFSEGRDIHYAGLEFEQDSAHFNITEFGIYGFGFQHQDSSYKTPDLFYVVIDQDYLDVMRTKGYAKEIDGVLSSRYAPLEVGRGKTLWSTAADIN